MESNKPTPDEILHTSKEYAKTHKHDTDTERMCCEADFRAGVAWALRAHDTTQSNFLQRPKKQEIIISITEMFCEDCKTGTYKTKLSNNDKLHFLHKCDNCGSLKYFNCHYPYIIKTEIQL